MFRGKESSNRIKLSRLVQDLLNFGVLGSLRLWGGGRWVGGIWRHGGVSTQTRTCTHAHLYMYRNCKWPPTWRHPCLACLTCMCMCVCACICMHRTCPTHPCPPPPPSTHPPIPYGVDPWNHLKFDNISTYQDISIPFEDLKSVKNSPPMGGCVVCWVFGWVDGWDQVKSLKI